MPGPQDVLDHARSELGTVEDPMGSNRTEYAAEVGHANGYAWCATFVAAMFKRAGVSLPNNSPYTPTMLNGLLGQDRRISGPEVGALAFLYFPSLRRVAHVGIVEAVRPDGRFVTIEGNTDETGGRTGGKVMRKVRARSGWTFVMPSYNEATKPNPPVSPHPIPSNRLVVDGDFGPNTIKALQRALNTRHGARPRLSIDGDFGPNTKRALQAMLNHLRGPVAIDGNFGPRSTKALQRYLNVVVDGDWGKNTTRALQERLNAGTF